jgi:hypothetical protein
MPFLKKNVQGSRRKSPFSFIAQGYQHAPHFHARGIIKAYCNKFCKIRAFANQAHITVQQSARQKSTVPFKKLTCAGTSRFSCGIN